MHLSDLEVAGPTATLTLPMTDLWLSPLHPTEARLTLPDTTVLDRSAGPVTLGLGEAGASLRLRPLGGLTLGSASLNSNAMTVEGAPLAEGLHLSAELARLGHDSPPAAVAAYDLNIGITGFDANLLAPELALPGALGLDGTGRIWLDRAPGPRTLSPETRPVMVGLQIDEARITLGKVTARITGRVQADAEGRAEGELTLSTADIKPLLQAAANAGMIPSQAVVLADTVFKKLATHRETGASATDSDASAPVAPELRLPLTFADGKTHLGPLPLGPAPLFPR